MQTINLKAHDDGGMDLDFFVIEGNDEIMQSLSIELGSALGEWLFDENYGIDRTKLTDKPYEEEVAAEVIRIVGNEPRVRLEGTVNVEMDMLNERRMNVSFLVRRTDTDELLEVNI